MLLMVLLWVGHLVLLRLLHVGLVGSGRQELVLLRVLLVVVLLLMLVVHHVVHHGGRQDAG